MKKTAIASALAMGMGIGSVNAITMSSATFPMRDGGGNTVGVDTTVTGSAAPAGSSRPGVGPASPAAALWTARRLRHRILLIVAGGKL